ncbi:MAG: FMN-binding protein [Chloroflexi bacterium]|nr:FMN-binding protein [Chloroflexota bacterium]
MNRNTVSRSMPVLALTVAAIAPVTGAYAGSIHAHSAKSVKAKAHTYKGSVEDMDRWGPIETDITVKNHKIIKVRVTVNPDNPRSQFIESNAIPLLRQETLQAQTAQIDEVSGATATSDAYMASLQSAIKTAKHHKALK